MNQVQRAGLISFSLSAASVLPCVPKLNKSLIWQGAMLTFGSSALWEGQRPRIRMQPPCVQHLICSLYSAGCSHTASVSVTQTKKTPKHLKTERYRLGNTSKMPVDGEWKHWGSRLGWKSLLAAEVILQKLRTPVGFIKANLASEGQKKRKMGWQKGSWSNFSQKNICQSCPPSGSVLTHLSSPLKPLRPGNDIWMMLQQKSATWLTRSNFIM